MGTNTHTYNNSIVVYSKHSQRFFKDSNQLFASLLNECIDLIFFKLSGIILKIVKHVVVDFGTDKSLGFISLLIQ